MPDAVHGNPDIVRITREINIWLHLSVYLCFSLAKRWLMCAPLWVASPASGFVRVTPKKCNLKSGIIEKRKFAYDLWGDTVNTASRMESHGVPGRVQISAATRAKLGDAFQVEPRGQIDVKGKGEMSTFLLAA